MTVSHWVAQKLDSEIEFIKECPWNQLLWKGGDRDRSDKRRSPTVVWTHERPHMISLGPSLNAV